jgi:hypothetical protein
MNRLSPLLLVIVAITPLLAQSQSDAPKQKPYSLITLAKYCANVEKHSDFQQARIFAQISYGLGGSSGWAEFESMASWRRAGRPKPLAQVWYEDGNIVRVMIASENGGDGQSYANYCYRPDGSLAELRPLTAVKTSCDQTSFYCAVTFRGATRFYLPKGMAIAGPVLLDMNPVIVVQPHEESSSFATPESAFDLYDLSISLKPEKATVSLAPELPEYLRVSDLPFNRLLFVFGE